MISSSKPRILTVIYEDAALVHTDEVEKNTMTYIEDLNDVETSRENTRRALLSSMPFWLAVTRTARMLIAFTTITLSGYAISVFGGDYFHTFGISFLAFVWTVIFMLYIFVTPERAPMLYLYRVHIILEVIATMFWIATVALLARECQVWDAAQNVVNDSFTPSEAAMVNSLPHEGSGVAAFRAALAMASTETLLFAATMFMIRRLLIQSMVEESLD